MSSRRTHEGEIAACKRTPRGKTANPGAQAHLQYELGSDSEEDTYDDKLRAEDYAGTCLYASLAAMLLLFLIVPSCPAGLLFMNPFAAHQLFQSEITRRGDEGTSQSIDVRHADGKLHVPLDGPELELSKRKKGAEKKPPMTKIPFFASERTRIRELIKQVAARKEAEERDRIQKLKEQQVIVRAAKRREHQQQGHMKLHDQMRAASERSWDEGGVGQATSLSADQVEISLYWGKYNGSSAREDKTPSATQSNRTKSDAGAASPQASSSKSLVEIAMSSSSAKIRALAAELQELQLLLLQKKAKEMLKESTVIT